MVHFELEILRNFYLFILDDSEDHLPVLLFQHYEILGLILRFGTFFEDRIEAIGYFDSSFLGLSESAFYFL